TRPASATIRNSVRSGDGISVRNGGFGARPVGRGRGRQLFADPGEDGGGGGVLGEGDEGGGASGAHLGGVTVHDVEVGADQRGQVGLVDHQQVGEGDAGAALAGHLVAARDVDDEDLHVDQAGGEGGGEVVAAGLHQDQIQGRVRGDQGVDGVEVGGDVVADGGVRAAGGVHGGDALVGQGGVAAKEVGVLGGVDDVGQHRQRQSLEQLPAQRGDQRGLAGGDGAADADAQRFARSALP